MIPRTPLDLAARKGARGQALYLDALPDPSMTGSVAEGRRRSAT